MATDEAVAGGWTYERYLQLDDDTRYEIIDGELLVTPAPTTPHQRLSGRLFGRLDAFVQEHGAGEVFYAPVDVVLDESGRNVVQPDLLFVGRARMEIIRTDAIHGAPDLVVEILSPSSLKRDRWDKSELYARVGIPEYWIVDPANRTIEILSLNEGRYELFSGAEGGRAAASRVLAGFAVAVEEVMPEAG